MVVNMNDVVYFELNNWTPGVDYPCEEPFLSWMRYDLYQKFRDEDWVKENKLCVVCSLVDMSQNYCISATKQWVEENCPTLLTRYQEFLRYPDEDGFIEGRFGDLFKEYNEDNIGLHYIWDEEEIEEIEEED